MPPFGGVETAEALSIMSLIFLFLGMTIFLETSDRTSPVLRIILTGMALWLFSIADVAILQAVFAGFMLYQCFRIWVAFSGEDE